MNEAVWYSLGRIVITLLVGVVGRALRKAALEHLEAEGVRIAIPRHRIETIS